jgi:glycosyltransferase involved in cell wall biosynthesis
MKVLFLSNIPTPNQLDFVEEVNNYLEFRYVVLYPTEPGRDWTLSAIPQMTILEFKKKLKDYKNYYKLINEYDPDVVIVGGYYLPLGVFSYLMCLISKKKFLYWLEKPNKSTGFKKILKHWIMKFKFFFIRPDEVLAIGQKTSAFYQHYFKHVENFPYSMKLNNYYTADRTRKLEKIKFLFSGQLIERKNIFIVVKAFSRLKNTDIELNIVGSGELGPTIEKYIENDRRINLLGFVDPENIYHVYHKNDVFVLPSLDDGWALVVNEAMASGMPIIGTNEVGAIEEFIDHKKNGFVCGIDVESIQKGMEYYINNRELVYKHGMQNREIIKYSLADVDNSAKKLKKILESLCQ